MNASRRFRTLLLCALMLGSAAARADITVYDSRASFLAVVNAYGVDSFDTLSPGVLGRSLQRAAGAYSYTATNQSDTGRTDLFTAVGSPGEVALSTQQSTTVVTFGGFAAGVTAAGGNFFTSDGSGLPLADEVIQVEATDADGTVSRYLIDSTPSTFLGFVSSGPLKSLTVTAVQDVVNVWPTIDDFTLGAMAAPVPEPAIWTMLLVGAGLLGCVRQRRSPRP